jgi:ribosomal 30S subunit maturation factor RimM
MFLKLGTIGRALGLQGSFYVSGRDEPIPPSVRAVRIGDSPDTSPDIPITSVGWHQDRPVLKCSLASNRTEAELLRGKPLWARAEEIKIDHNKEFLLKDLVGREVFDSEGKSIGRVLDVVILPASINMVVLSPDELMDVDIPVISSYVNMNFEHNGKRLNLVVPASIFEEIWNPRKKS